MIVEYGPDNNWRIAYSGEVITVVTPLQALRTSAHVEYFPNETLARSRAADLGYEWPAWLTE